MNSIKARAATSKPRVPDPPAEIGSIKLDELTWSPDQPLVRVYRLEHSPTAFNPGKGRGRFHPIQSSRGKPIPTLYAAQNLAGAAMETLFRATASDSVRRFVPRALVEQYGYATLKVRRALLLLPLWGNNLRRLGLTRGRLLEPGPTHYERTARWAAALHQGFATVDGLAWYSRQFDGSVCVMLFGDRFKQRDLKPIMSPISFADDSGFEVIVRIATQADITIVER